LVSNFEDILWTEPCGSVVGGIKDALPHRLFRAENVVQCQLTWFQDLGTADGRFRSKMKENQWLADFVEQLTFLLSMKSEIWQTQADCGNSGGSWNEEKTKI